MKYFLFLLALLMATCLSAQVNFVKPFVDRGIKGSITIYDFAVTPFNQIETLVAVYDETLPFSSRSYKILKEMMVDEKTDTYTLRAKNIYSIYRTTI